MLSNPINTNIDPGKVAVYIRWSTDEQTEGTTLAVQLERCKSFLASQGWNFSESLLYVDDGYSGGTLDRPAMARLRQDVAAGAVECVVVYKIDRLSRSVVDIVDLVINEWEGRCYVKSTTEEVNTLSNNGKMFFYLLASFAEYERGVIRERTFGGRVKRAEQGRHPGGPIPFGYKRGKHPGDLAVNPFEAAIVQRIFRLVREGAGAYLVATTLNQEGQLRRDKLWSAMTVRYVLRNRIYTGTLEYGWRSRNSQRAREKGAPAIKKHEQPRYASVQGAVAAIIPAAEFDAVQAVLRAKADLVEAGGKPTYSDHLLSGVARCTCGAALTATGKVYRCGRRVRSGRQACDSGDIKREVLDAAIAARVKALLTDVGKSEFLDLLQADHESALAQATGRRDELGARLGTCARRRTRLQADYDAGDLPAKLYAQDMQRLEAEEEDTRRQLAAAEEELRRLKARAFDAEQALAMLTKVQLWDQMTPLERKHLLQTLAAEITVFRRPSPNWKHNKKRPQQHPVSVNIKWVRV